MFSCGENNAQAFFGGEEHPPPLPPPSEEEDEEAKNKDFEKIVLRLAKCLTDLHSTNLDQGGRNSAQKELHDFRRKEHNAWCVCIKILFM